MVVLILSGPNSWYSSSSSCGIFDRLIEFVGPILKSQSKILDYLT